MHCGACFIHEPHTTPQSGTQGLDFSRNAPLEGAHIDSPREGLSNIPIYFCHIPPRELEFSLKFLGVGPIRDLIKMHCNSM